jgi:CHAT domain-containing protein
MRAEIEVLRQRQEALRAEIAERFPKYAELTRPPPLTLDQARALLGPGEALLVFSRAADPDKTHAWVFRHDRDLAYTAEIGLETIADDVADLRDGVDLANATSLSDLPRFDTRLAYDLYQRLMAPAEPLLEGVRHLYLVPDGALGGIPPGILVTAPQTLPPQTPAQYREVPWLARRFATTVLPSVTALRVLRRFSAQARAARPFVGFGDPLLEGPAGGGRGTIDFAALTRGGDGLADPEAVRRLPRLPDTAEELVAVAAALGSAPAAVHTGAAATERAVRRADLSDVRIISFATHGLVAGELSGLPEPALVLTPPERRSAEDDGLLMASEIARLKLNADWVVLSACNTAAGAGPDAEGLSGLANAFFYAGTRALLVSHWSVSSAATVRLMTGMFQAMADDPTLGRAEALRRVTLEMQSDPAHPEFAHPAFWAPFVVVGAGGAPAAR